MLCPTVHLIWTPVPSKLTLPPEQSKARWGFILAAAGSLDTVQAVYDNGLSLMATGDLRPSHEKAWKELWLKSQVEVTGSDSLCRAVIGCMFYLLSAFPSIHDTSGSFGGVSPGGLSNGGDGQDYWGHVFWDQVSSSQQQAQVVCREFFWRDRIALIVVCQCVSPIRY